MLVVYGFYELSFQDLAAYKHLEYNSLLETLNEREKEVTVLKKSTRINLSPKLEL